MEYVVIENTDIRVSRVAFGTGSLHHLFYSAERLALLEVALASGISHFDTSPYYGYGLAEIDLGNFIQGRRTNLTLSTKVGLYPWGWESTKTSSVWFRKALGKVFPAISLPNVIWSVERAKLGLHQSLRRLKTSYVDFLFLHEPNIALINTDEFLRWLESEKNKGSIRAWGLAGVAASVEPWVNINHALAQVIQTQDGLRKLQANFMLKQGRSLQFTYGYLSSEIGGGNSLSLKETLQGALRRNNAGSIIISTRNITHLNRLVGEVI